jgi:hypothetical protein
MIVWENRGMAKGYRPVRRDQPFLLPPDMREWLPPEHPVWLVITAVAEHLDTSAFHAGRKTGGAGGHAGDGADVGVRAPGDQLAADRGAVPD